MLCLPRILAGTLSYGGFGHVVYDQWEFAWRKFAFLVCFYRMILENALPILGSGPATIYRTALKVISEPRFPSFCVHVIKNGFKCPRCAAEQPSLKVSAAVCQNQHCSHRSSSQQCWRQQFSWWCFASLVLSPFQTTHTKTSFSCVLALEIFPLFWYFSLQYLNLATRSGRCLKKSIWRGGIDKTSLLNRILKIERLLY